MGKVNQVKIVGGLIALLFLAALTGRPAKAQEDPSGKWSPRFDEDQGGAHAGRRNRRLPGPADQRTPTRCEADSWDATLVELPENQCRQHGSDYGWRGPSQLSIWKEVDRASQKVIAYHTHLSAYGAEQTIWMDGRPHPPDYAPHTWQGFSTGKWEGDILVVDDNAPERKLARARTGSPQRHRYGDRAHHASRELADSGGDHLRPGLSDRAVNPHESTSFTTRSHAMAPWPCESVDEVDRPAGVVPDHLPGHESVS